MSNTMKIYLVRHGQNHDNARGLLNGHRDEPLTEVGIMQAHDLADRMSAAGLSFDCVLSSPLGRAFETAKIITSTLGLTRVSDPEIMPELIERDFGMMTGKSQTQIITLCAPDILQSDTITYFLSPEGAETFPQLLKRGKNILSLITERFSDGNILLVTHGDIGKMIYAAYYDLPWRDVLLGFHFGNSDLLELSVESNADDTHALKTPQHNL